MHTESLHTRYTHRLRTPGQQEQLVHGPLLQLRARLVGHQVQVRVRLRGLPRQVQGRRLLQEPPRPRHQTVDAPLLPPPHHKPTSHTPFHAPYVHTQASLPQHPPTLRRPPFTTHSCDTQSAWDTCNDVHGDVKAAITVRELHPTPPAHTPHTVYIRCLIYVPDPTPLGPSYKPHTRHYKPTARHNTDLHPTCQHAARARTHNLCLLDIDRYSLVSRTSRAPPQPLPPPLSAAYRGSLSSSMASPLPSSLLRVRVCVTYFSCVDSSLVRALYVHSARYLHALMRTRNTPNRNSQHPRRRLLSQGQGGHPKEARYWHAGLDPSPRHGRPDASRDRCSEVRGG